MLGLCVEGCWGPELSWRAVSAWPQQHTWLWASGCLAPWLSLWVLLPGPDLWVPCLKCKGLAFIVVAWLGTRVGKVTVAPCVVSESVVITVGLAHFHVHMIPWAHAIGTRRSHNMVKEQAQREPASLSGCGMVFCTLISQVSTLRLWSGAGLGEAHCRAPSRKAGGGTETCGPGLVCAPCAICVFSLFLPGTSCWHTGHRKQQGKLW